MQGAVLLDRLDRKCATKGLKINSMRYMTASWDSVVLPRASCSCSNEALHLVRAGFAGARLVMRQSETACADRGVQLQQHKKECK